MEHDMLTVLQGLTTDYYAVEAQAKAAEKSTDKSNEQLEAEAEEAIVRTASAQAALQELTQGGWQDFGACLGVDPDLFFPERGASTRESKEVCKGCSVRTECQTLAILTGEKFGIWGGLSERERRRVRRKYSIWCKNQGIEKLRITPVTLSGVTRSNASTPPSELEEPEDAFSSKAEFRLQFEGILARKQLELIQHILAFGEGGLVLPPKDSIGALSHLLNISSVALESQRLQPLLHGGMLSWVHVGDNLRLVVTEEGKELLRASGMKPFSPRSQPNFEVRTPVEVRTVHPVIQRPVLTSPRPRIATSKPVFVQQAKPVREETKAMDRLDDYEDLNAADIDILRALADKRYESADGRAAGLLAVDSGISTAYQSARLRLLDPAGLVEREVNGKRTTSIVITDKGREWFEKAVGPVVDGRGSAPADLPGAHDVPASQPVIDGSTSGDAASTQELMAAVVIRWEEQASLIQDIKLAVDGLTKENEKLRGDLEAMTAERDELLSADAERKQRLEQLKAQQAQLAAEAAVLE